MKRCIHCPHCGRDIQTDDAMPKTHCMYCGAPIPPHYSIRKERLEFVWGLVKLVVFCLVVFSIACECGIITKPQWYQLSISVFLDTSSCSSGFPTVGTGTGLGTDAGTGMGSQTIAVTEGGDIDDASDVLANPLPTPDDRPEPTPLPTVPDGAIIRG